MKNVPIKKVYDIYEHITNSYPYLYNYIYLQYPIALTKNSNLNHVLKHAVPTSVSHQIELQK